MLHKNTSLLFSKTIKTVGMITPQFLFGTFIQFAIPASTIANTRNAFINILPA